MVRNHFHGCVFVLLSGWTQFRFNRYTLKKSHMGKTEIGIVVGGTRGDVQPALVLGRALQDSGYAITIVAGSNFERWVQSRDLNFEDLGVDIRAMMESPAGKAWTRSGSLTQLVHMKRLVSGYSDVIVKRSVDVLPKFDAIISGLTTFAQAAVVAQTRDIPLFHLLFQPMYPTRSGAVSPSPVRKTAYSKLNLFTYPMMLRGLWYAYGSAMRETCDLLGVEEMTYKDFSNAWLNTPTVIAASPEVIPPPPDYPSHVHVTGFLFLDQGVGWTPPQDLSDFLESGEPPVYVGFGSMTGHASEDAALLIDALDGRRAVINQGWSDMHYSNLPDSVYLLKGAPHDWLFPRMSAVVHHGGAGTLAASLRAGVPILVIPHLADQFYFGRRVHELGAGPKPIPRKNLNAKSLKSALDELLENETFQAESERLGRKIQQENGVENIVAVIEGYLQSN
ncbi:MAG: hypothetical protein GF372_06120 [Candidatus Marinimicrobia bacterium]|nr:hypothetical protein [Candidatus Neomarinimicrobiota bacterium]